MTVNSSKILIVEDDAGIRNTLSIFLEAEGYEVLVADCGKAALRQLVSAMPDLVMLDLGLPDMDGQDVIAAVRQFSQVPILVVSARSENRQMVKALTKGAADYVTKPFRADVLLARIRANLREHVRPPLGELITNGPIQMDLARHVVTLSGRAVAFTPKEFELLKLFMTNKGKMLTHKHILRSVWGPSHADDTQYLRVYVGQVRRKLEAVPGLGRCIASESRVGYRMDPLAETFVAPNANLVAAQ